MLLETECVLPLVAAPAAVGSRYNCASGYCCGSSQATMSAVPLFGPSVPIGGAVLSVTVPLSNSSIEIRICLDENVANENIYVGAGVISVS